MARGDEFVEVELVEDDEPRGPRDDAGPATPRRVARWAAAHRPRVSERAWTRGVAAGAVLLAVVVLLDAHRAAERAAVLAGVEGLVGSLDEPPVTVWEAQDVYPVGAAGDGLVVMRYAGGDGPGLMPTTVAALDPADGSVVWEVETAGDSCQAWTRGGPDWGIYGLPPAVDAAQGARVVCTASGSSPDRTLVESREPATGALLASLALEVGGGYPVPLVGDLLVYGLDARGALTAVRWSPFTGEVWRQVLPEPLVEGGTEGLVEGTWNVFAELGDGALRFTAGDASGRFTSVVLDDADGALLDDPGVWDYRADLSWAVAELAVPGGGVARTVLSPAGTARVVVSERDGSDRFERDGQIARVAVDDGSRPGTLLVQGDSGRLTLVDAATGRDLGTAGTQAGGAPLRLDGVLVVAGSEAVGAWSLADGTALWSVDSDPWVSSVVSDGGTVALLEDYGSAIVGLDLHTGETRWSSTIEDGVALIQLGGRLFLVRQDGLAALGST
ncbi:MAG TPA: PQQ-binding-like beta-propeller repeat protein [Actinotalea sp.]|nr:PQQ-binding-like beta-propeller repeat protein [Actinotalea sp.]